MREGVFGEVEVGVDVRVEGFEPLVSGGGGHVSMNSPLMWGAGLLCKFTDAVNHVLIGGVVGEDVDGAHFRDGLLDELGAIRLLGEVGGEEVAFGPVLLDCFLSRFGVFLFFGQIGDHAVCSFHGVEDGNCASDAGVATCDDGFLAFQLAGWFVGLVAAICCISLGQHYAFRGAREPEAMF